MRPLPLIALASLGLLLIATAACRQTKEVGRSTKELFTGTTAGTVDRTQAEVEQAIDATVADLRWTRIGATTKPNKKTGPQTQVVIRNPADDRIVVTYHPVSDAQTHVAVGTGAFGDSALRQQVWDNLRVRLGVLGTPATAAPTTRP